MLAAFPVRQLLALARLFTRRRSKDEPFPLPSSRTFLAAGFTRSLHARSPLSNPFPSPCRCLILSDTTLSSPPLLSLPHPLLQKTRKINIINTLTQQEHELTVCSEETVSEIQARYISFNGHAASYTWKRLTDDGDKFVVMDMDKTLEGNGVVDEDTEFEKLHIPDNFYVPVIHIYFNDDLSIA
jgi:hypothetical protein